MAKRGTALLPNSPAMPPTSHGPASYETPARGTSMQSHPTSPSSMFRSVRLHATTASPGEASARSHVSGMSTKVNPNNAAGARESHTPLPTPPPTPRADHRETPSLSSVQLGDPEEQRTLSPMSTDANLSTVGGSQYEASTIASEAASATKMLLRASEMIHGEVKQCEARMLAVFEKEREARELSCNQLRINVEEMMTFVEAVSSQVHAASTPDNRLDVFLEQEKRARDALREDVEALADQVACLDDDRTKAASGSSSEDYAHLTSILDQERAARDTECAALRKDLDALSSLAAQERSGRDLSIAVLRKDLCVKIDAVTGDMGFLRDLPPRQPSPAAQISESRINDLLEQQRSDILEQQRITVDATCMQLRKEVEAMSVVMRSLPSADVAVKCTGGTGNSEDQLSGNLVPLAEIQHQLQARKEESSCLESLTDQLRLDFKGSAQSVNLRLEKVDQAINDLQFDIRSCQIAELTPTRSSLIRTLGDFVCGRG